MNAITAIFDIGKTNKKCIVFDSNWKVIYKEEQAFNEILDDEGFPCEDLSSLQKWIFNQLDILLWQHKIKVSHLNFSSYGASWVHLSAQGEGIGHLYNYLKPFDEDLQQQFYNVYGPEAEFNAHTGSPKSGMLNSGMQLYWLKYKRPDLFNQIQTSIHFPQYLSSLFTKQYVSDYTSIGCHTALWDYSEKNYHRWVEEEQLTSKLLPIVPTKTTFSVQYKGNPLTVGIGIHDSSAALYPYLIMTKRPFLLVSTGTWAVVFNPYATQNFLFRTKTPLFYMQPEGRAVQAIRLFMGKEYDEQLDQISSHFRVSKKELNAISYQSKYTPVNLNKPVFQWIYLDKNPELLQTNWDALSHPEAAVHHLVYDLTLQLSKHIREQIQLDEIEEFYIEGGFSKNTVFLTYLSYFFPEVSLYKAETAVGSALGAALVLGISEKNLDGLRHNLNWEPFQPVFKI
jgi:sugar (pentulose or hexulose) kinase